VKRCHVWVRLVPSVGQTGAICWSDWCHIWVRLVPSVGQTGAICGSDVPRVGQGPDYERILRTSYEDFRTYEDVST